MYRVGISTCGGKPTDLEEFTAMKSAGMDAVEICLSDYKDLDFKKVRNNADATGIELFSIHSHMRPDFDISSLDKESNKRALNEFCWLIDKISEIEIDKIVIHPTHFCTRADQARVSTKQKGTAYDIPFTTGF